MVTKGVMSDEDFKEALLKCIGDKFAEIEILEKQYQTIKDKLAQCQSTRH